MRFLCSTTKCCQHLNIYWLRKSRRNSDSYYHNLAHERKHGVTGEVDVSSKPITVVEKDARTKELLKKALMENKFLGGTEESLIDEFVSVMYPQTVKANARLIREGDIGSYLYVSEEGTFNIYVGNTFYGSFGPGVAFGELALLYNITRMSSIDAQTNGKVWVLDRQAYQTIMVKSTEEQTQYYLDLLRRIAIFKDLADEVLLKICDLLIVEFYPSHMYIVREGDPGEKFYIVTGGNVRITKCKPNGLEEELTTLGRGEYFGEKALYEEDATVRQASAIAVPPGAECYTISRNAFLEYLGELESIKNRNWETYHQITVEENWAPEFQNMKLSDLKVEGTIGSGSYGRVELVFTDQMPNASFARKKVKKHMISRNGFQKLVYNEKNNLRACASPFICKLYRTFKDNRYLYFLLEVSLGGDLRTALHRNGRFENSTTRFIAACVVEGLAHIHSAGIIYRDLKPENVVIDHRGYAKLTDFGSSKQVGAFKTNTFIGTPEYVAPEMIQSRSYNKAVDFWALGILVYELLLGRTPFQHPNDMDVYTKILAGFNAALVPPVVRRSAKELIASLLEEDPVKRLGHLRNGVNDVRNHRWFSSFGWQELKNQTLPSPIEPTVKGCLDMRNFERYPPDRIPAQMDFSDWDANF